MESSNKKIRLELYGHKTQYAPLWLGLDDWKNVVFYRENENKIPIGIYDNDTVGPLTENHIKLFIEYGIEHLLRYRMKERPYPWHNTIKDLRMDFIPKTVW
jgi:hypothetical protein